MPLFFIAKRPLIFLHEPYSSLALRHLIEHFLFCFLHGHILPYNFVTKGVSQCDVSLNLSQALFNRLGKPFTDTQARPLGLRET